MNEKQAQILRLKQEKDAVIMAFLLFKRDGDKNHRTDHCPVRRILYGRKCKAFKSEKAGFASGTDGGLPDGPYGIGGED